MPDSWFSEEKMHKNFIRDVYAMGPKITITSTVFRNVMYKNQTTHIIMETDLLSETENLLVDY